jgi:hypothetical protein
MTLANRGHAVMSDSLPNGNMVAISYGYAWPACISC